MRVYRDQHFLIDRTVVERIAALADPGEETVLEVGPGRGVLTRALLSRGARVIAVEIDGELANDLNSLFSEEIAAGQLVLVHGDAIRCQIPPFSMVVSNLPYSASSPIMFRLLATGFSSAVLMFQSEFAHRMVAPTGTPGCGRLSVMVQTYCTVERCFHVSPSAFSPKPQVRSTVVRLIPREPIFPIKDRGVYADVVRALFVHRRKTVRNCLRQSGALLHPGVAEAMIAALPAGVLDSRPEELYLEDFATIANIPG